MIETNYTNYITLHYYNEKNYITICNKNITYFMKMGNAQKCVKNDLEINTTICRYFY